MNKISLIEQSHRKELESLRSDQIRARQEQKDGLEHLHGLSGHPKADILYQVAWDMGYYVGGFAAVKFYYHKMAELVK